MTPLLAPASAGPNAISRTPVTFLDHLAHAVQSQPDKVVDLFLSLAERLDAARLHPLREFLGDLLGDDVIRLVDAKIEARLAFKPALGVKLHATAEWFVAEYKSFYVRPFNETLLRVLLADLPFADPNPYDDFGLPFDTSFRWGFERCRRWWRWTAQEGQFICSPIKFVRSAYWTDYSQRDLSGALAMGPEERKWRRQCERNTRAALAPQTDKLAEEARRKDYEESMQRIIEEVAVKVAQGADPRRWHFLDQQKINARVRELRAMEQRVKEPK